MDAQLSRRSVLLAGAVGGAAAALGTASPPAHAAAPAVMPPAVVREPVKVPEAIGTGGAVSCVDPYAADVGIRVLRAGGNAADAAVAMAATLGVTEPYSSGIGGGGFFVFHHARSGRTYTINGREAAPLTYTSTEFTDGNGNALDFDTVVSSGKSVGVPGTLMTWAVAAARFGTRRLADLLAPAEALAREGFVVDAYYRSLTAQNEARFRTFPETVRVYLPGGQVPAVGATQRNVDLADTYRLIRQRGVGEFYYGRIARAIVDEVTDPTTAPGVSVLRGEMRLRDITRYRAPIQEPTTSRYRGYELRGMSIPSSGGIAVGEILNLLDAFAARTGRSVASLSQVDYLHWFSEASALAFADRNRYVGDVRGVPVRELLSPAYARERALLFNPDRALARPVPFGSPDGDSAGSPGGGRQLGAPNEGRSTTHLNVADRWGNVVAYTLTIEQTGGSGITLPGYGFLLNNELTDFDFVPLQAGVPDPNLPGPGKRPRSSMSPSIVFSSDGGGRGRHGGGHGGRLRPVVAAGTPGGATIITSVAQILVGYLDRDLDLVDAIAAPRLSSRNGSSEGADLGLATSPVGQALTARGHRLSSQTWIGNASGIGFEGSRLVAAAETVRGDGGAARVVIPS
ncbi:gamma-glutamyltransferase family protein [Luteipulveratus flavus]|uniref:Gamma-glutamyltransferase family protein n=1 Tax=Luteipulveratus flavus TaxID=3031728 RepID=A0ABT6C8E8_9MICO|nr:gamma-glutamyltransferase family protein [Luteipulveratus sp. YIM 133296]MDF8265160.1 gamma-glutamyltransferase family protein [Luteipulveratus sp. YIM 133296]